MKSIILRKPTVIIFVTIFMAVLLSSCGGNANSSSSESSGDPSGSDPAVIPVGVCSTAKPDAYIDEDGKLTGYDVEVLKAIDELLPQYELDLQTMEFSEILNSLATSRVLAGSQEFEWNAERANTYLFGEVPLIGYNTFIITLDDPQYENITGLADLAGKSTLASQGGSVEAIINSWNEENPDKEIKKVISGGTSEDYVNFLNNRVVDFIIANEQNFVRWTEDFNVDNWVFHEQAKIYDSNSYILFEKNQVQLQQDFDDALQELSDNGKLAELSIEFYGKDYTVH
ncbi:MAG: transporter substrate-binding domain-containing protein [Clostridiales Family XIII bacterium]|jgi:L-cystine transport system substrate-binding protein|nr:transporter substrate-binding domain-containing protein [Clostridiales Family XIII bacterium]